ncbi:MAG: MGMT family protein [Bacteroidales bacterium]|nr:MGMT family protein [Bacteroidales bacterium]
MENKNGFFEQVYQVVLQIPYGRVTSYGAIAAYLGSKGSARMVGWALNSSRFSKVSIPAHRVVNQAGLLTGKRHFGGQDIMEELLRSEGITVEGGQIMNMEHYFWDPSKELEGY